MKFRSIHLENYRSHVDTTLDLNKLTMVRGGNHSGKSSIEQAIETCFARRNATTGENGQGLTESIRFGEDKAVIEIIFDHEGFTDIRLRASITAKSGLEVTLKRLNDKEWNPVPLTNQIKRDRAILSCLCNSRYFVSLEAKHQKALLASIVLPTRMEVPEETNADLHKQGIQGWDSRNEGGVFPFIEGTYKLAFDQRTAVNRSLKDWHAPEKGDTYTGPDVNEVRAKLNQRQTERTELALAKQKLANEIEKAKSRKADFERKAAENDAKAQNERRQREEIAKGVLGKAALKTAEKEAGGAAEAQKLDDSIRTRSAKMEVLHERLSKIQNIGSFGAQCPTCLQAINEEIIDKIIEPFQKEWDEITEAQRVDFETRKALGDPAGAQKKIDAHKTVEADLKRIDTRITDLERQAQVAREEAAKIDPAALPQPESMDAQIEDIDTRIQKGSNVVAMAAAAAEQERAYAQAVKRKTELEEEQARLERLVEFFGPNGIKAKLIAEHIGPFQTSINAVLARWGYECALEIEPEYGFIVKPQGSPFPARLHQLSQSEQYRFSAAFSVALAVVSGWKFVICDGADILDNRNALNAALMSKELDQGIVLATDLAQTMPARPVPGVTFIRLTDAVVEGVRTTTADVLEPALAVA
jgi:hypothetical protein